MDELQGMEDRFVGMMLDHAEVGSVLPDHLSLERALMRAEARLQIVRLTSILPDEPMAEYIVALTQATLYAWLLYGDEEEARRNVEAGRAAFDSLEFHHRQGWAQPGAPKPALDV